jgi:hypothetical protein
MQSLRDQPLSLQSAQEIDEALGGLIDKEFGVKGLSKDGRNLLNLQSTFRDMIANAGANDVQGGTAGFEALSGARQAWAAAMKMDDLERIQARAELTDNPATSIKSQLRVLLSNRTKARGYSDDEIEALKDAANRGVLGGALHVFGSRLLPLMGAVTGGHTAGALGAVVGGGLTHGAASAMRSGAEALQAGRLRKAMDVVSQGVPQPPGWRPPPAPQIEAPNVAGMIPWRAPLGLAQPEPTSSPPTSRNPVTGLPEYSLEANQQVASGHDIGQRLMSGELSDHKAINDYVNQNKRELRQQFGGQGIQNIMRMGALVRRASTEETPSTVLSVLLKGGAPDIMAKAGDPSALISKAIASPELAKLLATRTKGAINKIGQNRLLAALGGGDAKLATSNNSASQDESSVAIPGGGNRIRTIGAGRGDRPGQEAPADTPPAHVAAAALNRQGAALPK